MKTLSIILIIIFAVNFAFPQSNSDVVRFKGKVGFVNNEDEIVEHKFLDGGKRLLIFGEKKLQIWDVESGQLKHSIAHQISQFEPDGFVSTYLLLGFPKFLNWRPYIVDEKGRWIITSEKIGANKFYSAIVRDLETLRQIAVLEIPDISTSYITYDEAKNEILTFGVTNETAGLARWSVDDFSNRGLLKIDEYKWHQTIRGEQKILVGSGDVKVFWSGFYNKQGENLTLRDSKTGKIEKTYFAENLKPKTSFQDTTVSSDERFLISKRDDRVFVWEIDGDGKPKFEISNPDPKGDFDFKQIIDRRFIPVKFDKQIRIYDIEGNGSPMFSIAPQNEKENLSFDGFINERFAVIKADRKFRVYDTQGGQTLKFELASDDPKDTMRFYGAVKGGKYIIARDDNKVLILETAGDGKPLYEIVRSSEKERFPTISTIDNKNLLFIARVNKSEKKPPVTEFYDVETGKLVFDAGFEANHNLRFTPDDTRLYQEDIGSFKFWNLKSKMLEIIPLQTREEKSYDVSNMEMTAGTTYNSESAEFSSDYRFILRRGEARLTVFDTQTGKEIPLTASDGSPQPAKKGKPKQIRFGESGWLLGGKYVYAINETGFFISTNTISLWEVKN